MKLPEQDLTHVLDHTRDLWEDLRGAHLFITGGTGFFGCWLLESFLFANQHLDLKASASVLTRRPDSVKRALPHLMLDPAISLHEGDVRSFEFPKGEYSHIIHAATETSPQLETIEPLELFTSNIEGTRRVLDFAVSSKTSKLLFTSSGAVYGKQPSDMTHIPENYPGAPETSVVTTAYGQSKRASEFLCTAYANKYGFQAAIARCFAFVGPYLPLEANYAIGNFIRDAMNGRPIQVNGDGTPFRSYLYAADLAIWLWTILLRGQSDYSYNVGSENDLTIAQLASVVVNELAPNTIIKVAKQPVFQQPASRYVPSTQRARQDLKLEVWIPLNEAIRRTADFYKS
jgi:nucleoside-diphosphate-sugar epimerase